MTADPFTAQPEDLPEGSGGAAGIVPFRPPGRPEGVSFVGYVEGIDRASPPVGADMSTVTIAGNIMLDRAGRERLDLLLRIAGQYADDHAAQEAAERDA